MGGGAGPAVLAPDDAAPADEVPATLQLGQRVQ